MGNGFVAKAKLQAASIFVNQAINYLEKDPEKNAIKILDLADKVLPDGWYLTQRNAIRNAIEKKDNWYQLLMRFYELDTDVRKTFFRNFIINSAIMGSAEERESEAKYNCNVPWAILLDPTSACNLHCTGCWAAEYGNRLNLSLDEMDSIVTQGKALGTYMYIFTGGEPLVRKKDIIA